MYTVKDTDVSLRNEVNQIKIGRDHIKILCEVHEDGFYRLTEKNKQTAKVWGKMQFGGMVSGHRDRAKGHHQATVPVVSSQPSEWIKGFASIPVKEQPCV